MDEAGARGLKATGLGGIAQIHQTGLRCQRIVGLLCGTVFESPGSVEVVRKEIKPGTITGLRRTYDSIGQHWFGFRTLSLSRITPKAMDGIVKFLLTKAKNLVKPGTIVKGATYNGYVSALARQT